MSVAQTFEAAISAFKDIIKFKVVQYVNTGDKTLDNLYNAFFVTLITLVFSMFSYQSLLIKYNLWKYKKNPSKLDEKTIKHYTEYLTSRRYEFSFATWYLNGGKEARLFTNRFINYFTTHYGWKLGSSKKQIIDTKTYNMTGKFRNIDDTFDAIRRSICSGEHFPIYIDSNGIVGIYKDFNEDTIMLMYNNNLTLQSFMDILKNIEVKEDEEVEKEEKEEKGEKEDRILNIYRHNYEEIIGFIYKDRNFDMFISRHKTMILNKIESFVKANSIKNIKNPYINYNLGFILHGKPGTGKTMFIKALCNKLQRDARIIDMRLIKTRADFEKIFVNHNNYVYVLDEFDCVQGVIASRESKQDGHEIPNPLSELRERHLSILNMLSNRPTSVMISTSSATNNNEEHDPLMIELNNIRRQIKEIENGLTLDTILTVLEGMCEMRGRVMVATTNYIDRIDGALLREGRFDEKIELTPFNMEEIREMLGKIFETATSEELELLNTIPLKENVYTPTAIIGLVSKYRDLHKIIDIMKQ